MDECFKREIIVKQEIDDDEEYESPRGKIQQDDIHYNYSLQRSFGFQVSSENFNDATVKARKLKKIAFGDKKKRLAKIIKEYPFLWDKNHKFYRSRQNRDEAWRKIAIALDITALEVKALWKKLKDTHRYLSSKAKKKSDFNPYDFCDNQDDESDIIDDLAFLDDNLSNCLAETSSLVKDATYQSSASMFDPLNIDDSNCGDNLDTCLNAQQTNVYKISSKEIPTAVGNCQISSFNFDEKHKKNMLKHIHIWMQLEKLFEKLDDDKITDLNFLFVSETYKAILDKRNNQ